MTRDLLVSESAIVDDQGAPSTLSLAGLTVNGVTLTGNTTANTLTISAALNTFHDFTFIPATHMTTSGTMTSAAATVAGAPRVVLAKGQRVKWAREVPAGWSQVSTNILWTKEAVGSGNVHWSLTYTVLNFLAGVQFDGAPTTVDVAPIAVPASVQQSMYTITAGAQAIATPAQAFGIPPLLICSLTYVSDAGSSYAGDVGVVAMNLSRTS